MDQSSNSETDIWESRILTENGHFWPYQKSDSRSEIIIPNRHKSSLSSYPKIVYINLANFPQSKVTFSMLELANQNVQYQINHWGNVKRCYMLTRPYSSRQVPDLRSAALFILFLRAYNKLCWQGKCTCALAHLPCPHEKILASKYDRDDPYISTY